MPKGFIFWALMFFWILCQLGVLKPDWKDRASYAGSIVLLVLLGLLGWAVYGPAAQ